MTMHKALHPRDDVDTLYVSRREGGRGLASIENSVDASIQPREDYIQKRKGRLTAASRNNTNDTRTSGMTITRKQKWKEKQLYGRFKRLTSDVSHEKMWMWLRKGNLKGKTESLLVAAQNKYVRTRHIKGRIDKTKQNSRCRLCGHRDKMNGHIISECNKLAQKEHKTRHDWVGRVIHWELCKKLKFDHRNKWNMYNLESVLENDTHKLCWDFEIKMDHQFSATRPDLIIINKKARNYRIMDFAVPADHRIKLKECEKRDKYWDLVRELKNCGTWKWRLYQL